MQGKGLSAKTIKNVHGLLSAALKTATVLGYFEDNPCRGVPLPKSTATDDHMRLLPMPKHGSLSTPSRITTGC